MAQNPKMAMSKGVIDTRFWDLMRGKIRNRKGGWRIGKDVTLHGKSLLRELMGSASWFQVWLLSLTGRTFEKSMADWCEVCWLCLSYPDSRIWCNHISALIGTNRGSPSASMAAATLASDSLQYASLSLALTADFLREAIQKRKQNLSISQILEAQPKNKTGGPKVPGFNRPIALGDERVQALDRTRQQYGLPVGECLQLALEIHEYLKKNYGEQINSAGYASAFFIDQGFTSEEIHRFFSTSVICGAMSCYVDAYERGSDSFLPMRCEDVDYQGPAPRPFPKR